MDSVELELKNAYREGYLAFMNNEECDPPYNDKELDDAWVAGWEESKNEN
jgi:ribosome modulation factor